MQGLWIMKTAEAEMKIEKHCSLFNKMEATGDLSNRCLGDC